MRPSHEKKTDMNNFLFQNIKKKTALVAEMMDMENTYESIVLGTAAKEGRVFTSEEKTLYQT